MVLTIDSKRFFLVQLTAVEERRKNHLNLLLRVLSSKVQLRFESLIKGTAAPAADLRHYPHSVCDILVFFSNREEIVKGNTGSVESQLLYPTAVHCSRSNTLDEARAGYYLQFVQRFFLSDSQRLIGEGESDQETIASFLATA